MANVRKRIVLNKIDYHELHLQLINCILPKKLTPMQIKVLANFMVLEGDIAKFRFGPSAKKIVRGNLNLSPSGMSNYINDLLEGGFLKETGDIIEIHPLLIPNDSEQEYLIKLVNQEHASTGA